MKGHPNNRLHLRFCCRNTGAVGFLFLMLSLFAPALSGQTINGLSKNYGRVGEQIQIYGSGFTVGTVVRFHNNVVASSATVAATQITATVPQGAVTGRISVSNGTTPSYSADIFTVIGPEPYITGFSPEKGVPGATGDIHITGVQFATFNPTVTVTNVTIGGTRIPDFYVPSDTLIIIRSLPAGVMTGPIALTRAGWTGTSSTNFFIQPSITGFSPSSGRGGTNVLITGTSFLDASLVEFNGLQAAFTVLGNTQIQATVPSGVTTGPLVVRTPGGLFQTSSNFVVLPTISSFTPNSGPPGTAVTIFGANLNVGTPVVRFGGLAATVNSVSANQIVAIVPAEAVTGFISITTADGTATTSEAFVLPPTISSIAPTNGVAGTLVTIRGANFAAKNDVRFNGTPATDVTVVSETEIRARAPAGVITGPISVATGAGTAISSQFFYAPPAIANHVPLSGTSGTQVRLFGTNFLGTWLVQVNTLMAEFVVTNNYEIRFTVPAEVATGTIRVWGVAGIADSPDYFYVPPITTSFSPGAGGPGTQVTIHGANLLGATSVRFSDTEAQFTPPSNNSVLHATVPPNVTTGPISVTTPAGTAVTGDIFFGPPGITSFAPLTGRSGTNITIVGKNFTGATAVFFNTSQASAFQIVSPTEISVTVPPSATSGTIRVIGPGGEGVSPENFVLETTSDLALTMTASPVPVVLHSNLTLTLTVQNLGPHPAPSVNLTNRLPPNVQVKSLQSTHGVVSLAGETVNGALGYLLNGASATVTIVLAANDLGSITNRAGVFHAGNDPPDPDLANNAATLAVQVVPHVRLAVRLLDPGQIELSWLAVHTNFTLQATTNLNASNQWSDLNLTPSVVGDRRVVTNAVSGQRRFFRLRNTPAP
jgi:large repetitive protein